MNIVNTRQLSMVSKSLLIILLPIQWWSDTIGVAREFSTVGKSLLIIS